MNALVLYDSQFGNTERIAQAIADALRPAGHVRIARIDPAQPVDLHGVDLLIVGSPTQGWNATPAIRNFLEHAPAERLAGLAVACFDTRFRRARWLTGSAARVIGRKLRKRGAALRLPPESFFVAGTEGPLLDGELAHAATWAGAISQVAAH
jgi:flavodoxin